MEAPEPEARGFDPDPYGTGAIQQQIRDFRDDLLNLRISITRLVAETTEGVRNAVLLGVTVLCVIAALLAMILWRVW